MRMFKKILGFGLVFAWLTSAVSMTASAAETVQKIELSSTEANGSYAHTATIDGAAVPEYDYTWHADPSQAHDDVKNSPAEYYTGTKPGGDDPLYIAHDIIYYPELSQDKFQKVNYDGETEWVYMYEAEGYEDYIFSTLPVRKDGFPTQMMHAEAEAYGNAVLHITQPGTYEIIGQWHGQLWVDLGDEDDVYADPSQKVTLILNGVDITCTVAPGVVFYSVYECDNAWEKADSYSQKVDTGNAGANVVLADGTVNNVAGTNVFRILKTKFKDDSSADAHPAQKKSWKIDGAFYSYQSLNISGGGTLNITAGFEGLDTEHHLTLDSGNVNIYSQDDGINVNEDGVSVLTVNGGNLHICAGLGAEGDGIDSNGFLVVNGGTVITMANPAADSGLDSDCGSFVNGGTVVALGATMDWAESDETADSTQPVLNLRFGSAQSADEAIVITDAEDNVVFAYDPDQDEVARDNQRTYQGAIISAPGLVINGSYYIYIGGDVTGAETSGVYGAATVTGFAGATQQGYSGNTVGGFGGGKPNGMTPPEGMQRPEDMTMPEGMKQPEGMTMPEGMEWPEDMTMPEGMQQPEGMTMPEGMKRPEDMTMPEGMQQPGNMTMPEGMEWPAGALTPGQMPEGMKNQSTGANCGGEAVFTLAQQVNAFSGVNDLTHTLTRVEAQEAQYGQNCTKEHYVCESCGKLFADENAVTELTAQDVTIPGRDYTLFIIALFFVGFVLLAAIVVGILLLYRKKHKKDSPDE